MFALLGDQRDTLLVIGLHANGLFTPISIRSSCFVKAAIGGLDKRHLERVFTLLFTNPAYYLLVSFEQPLMLEATNLSRMFVHQIQWVPGEL